MTVFLPNLPILVVDHKFGFLVAADFTSYVHRYLLGVSVLDGTLTPANLNVPATIF